MSWHEEVLDAAGLRAADRLAKLLRGKFYLAGGTALALRHGHRKSHDLDLFSAEVSLTEAEREGYAARLSAQGGFEIVESAERTCHWRLGGTAVSLFSYRYPLLKRTETWRGIPVAADADIAAMKLNAVVNRGARKDFLDLHLLARREGLGALLEHAARKFKEFADFPMTACKALVYFDDAEKEPMPNLLKDVSWGDIKAYFEREVRGVVRRGLK